MDYELKDFEKDVLETAKSTPVVIDFWAEWCGPCRQLGPTIEKLAKESNGRWKLVKIDTDKNPDIAIQFGVRGIPAVKMVYQQEVIAEFTGAQPEHLIRKWLDENLPEGSADNAENLTEAVNKLLGEGKREQAKALLEDQIAKDSETALKVRLAMLLLPGQIDEAQKWMGEVEEREKYDIEFQVLETVIHLAEIVNDEKMANGSKATQLYLEATTALMKTNFEEALPKFIESLQLDRSLDDDGPRRACIACFNMLGDQHPLSIQYRRAFSMSLY